VISGLVLRGLVVAAVLGIVTTLYFSWQSHQRGIGAQAQYLEDKAVMDGLKAAAAAKLAEVTAQRDATEQVLRKLKDEQEIKDAKNKTTTAALATKLAAMSAAAGGRLRDPNAETGCGGSGGSSSRPPTATASDSNDDGAKTGGLLSTQLSGLLQRLNAEADEINNAYASCRATLMQEEGG